jgi:hypothetical protein
MTKRAFHRTRYCTVLSEKQLEEAKKSYSNGNDTQITVVFQQNINDQKTKPFYKTLSTWNVYYSELNFV